ncbi:MAG: RDD family protein [Candidatus Thermoplasmatota archaeon]|nr:RDD family protein [Candidatus Thermoplasmatota archaeon]
MGTTGFNQLGNKALQEHWLRRFVAIIIDSIIISIVVFALGTFLWFLGIYTWGWLFTWVFLFLYVILMEISMGATIGKKLMSLHVVGILEPRTPMMVLVRNVSKLFGILLLLDWLVGMFTPGDPRQKYTDRMIGCTVARTDEKAYMEEQFRVAQFYRPPPAHGYQPYQQQPQQQPYQQQPQQEPQQQPYQQPPATGGGWGDQPEQTGPQPKYCQSCGGPLNVRPDGRLQCPSCGAMY